MFLLSIEYKNLKCSRVKVKATRKTTTENTVFFTKKRLKNLQVENLRIMFVSESNNPLENDEIRTPETNLPKTGNCFLLFQPQHSVLLLSQGQFKKT